MYNTRMKNSRQVYWEWYWILAEMKTKSKKTKKLEFTIADICDNMIFITMWEY